MVPDDYILDVEKVQKLQGIKSMKYWTGLPDAVLVRVMKWVNSLKKSHWSSEIQCRNFLHTKSGNYEGG